MLLYYVIFILSFTQTNILQTYYVTAIDGFDASMYETKQIFFDSKDGTRIPMFIFSKKVSMNCVFFKTFLRFYRTVLPNEFL